jgi:RimJ/RimL family protein N-acetyltransferase
MAPGTARENSAPALTRPKRGGHIMAMPKMPQTPRKPHLVTPLAAMKLKPVFVDRVGKLVRLRTLGPGEVTPEIADWLTDPAIMEGLNAPRRAMGLDAFRVYVGSFDNLRRNLMAIRDADDDTPLGLLFLDVDLRHKLGSAHIVIGKDEHRRMDVIYDATRVLMWHFFTERKLEKLTFAPLSRNRAAVAACRVGMLRLEGELKSHRIDGRTGERVDQMLFAMTLDEFRQRMKALVEPPAFSGAGVASTHVVDQLIAAGWMPPAPD